MMTAYAHGKLILSGEHGVVHGNPAIALPIPLKARAFVQPSLGEIELHSSLYTGPLSQIPKYLEALKVAILESLKVLHLEPRNLKCWLASEIPIGRGLGSSAATATALVRSLFVYAKVNLSQELLFELVQKAERIAHGNPSGVDAHVVSQQLPIWFEKDKGIRQVTINKELFIVLADTGHIGQTKVAVERVGQRLLSQPHATKSLFKQMKKVTNEVEVCLRSGDWQALGKLLDENQSILDQLGVSDDSLNQLITIGKNAGALGGKLTGGGLGGCMIAVSDSLENARQISTALKQGGALSSWYFSTATGHLMSIEREELRL